MGLSSSTYTYTHVGLTIAPFVSGRIGAVPLLTSKESLASLFVHLLSYLCEMYVTENTCLT